MFSVVVPLYNKERSIRQTIQSVLDQTFDGFEIVVVNDGSTDNSRQVVQDINDPRIRIVDKPNGGVSSARNRGINEANFEWIAFLDGDDLWKSNHLEIIKALIDEFPADVAFCTSFIESSNKNLLKDKSGVNSTVIVEDYFKEAIRGHFFWTSVVAIRQSIFDKIGTFNEKLVLGEDLDLWARLGRNYRIIKSTSITAVYNLDAENRACNNSYDYSRSFISTIHLSGKSKSETKYLKYLLWRRVYMSLRNRNFSMAFKILRKILW